VRRSSHIICVPNYFTGKRIKELVVEYIYDEFLECLVDVVVGAVYECSFFARSVGFRDLCCCSVIHDFRCCSRIFQGRKYIHREGEILVIGHNETEVAMPASSFVRRKVHGVVVYIVTDDLEIFEGLPVIYGMLLCRKPAMSSSGVDAVMFVVRRAGVAPCCYVAITFNDVH
jgi:hypothetical protein